MGGMRYNNGSGGADAILAAMIAHTEFKRRRRRNLTCHMGTGGVDSSIAEVINQKLDNHSEILRQHGDQLRALTDAVTSIARLEERLASQNASHARFERELDELWSQMRGVGEQAAAAHRRHMEHDFKPLERRVAALEQVTAGSAVRWGFMDGVLWKIVVPIVFMAVTAAGSWFAATTAAQQAAQHQVQRVDDGSVR